MATSKVSLKLVVDKKNQKVLFAEAGKAFVDFLFNLLTLPLGSVVRILSKSSMDGSLPKLYESFANLDETYIQTYLNKKSMLSQTSPLTTTEAPLLLSNSDSLRRILYTCNKSCCCSYMSDDPELICPSCTVKLNRYQLSYVGLDTRSKVEMRHNEGGFVKGVSYYMVMDDLEVKPSSAFSSIGLLMMFNVKDLSAIEEMVVDVNESKGLELLRASMHSKTVLSDVFLEKQTIVKVEGAASK